jgi:NADPH:quinone reductase-like Zn-dependent oxidoreductase
LYGGANTVTSKCLLVGLRGELQSDRGRSPPATRVRKENDQMIVVLGATGATGRLVITRALAAQHAVTAVVRSTGHEPFPAEVTVVRADVTDRTSLAPAVQGADALIGTLGRRRAPSSRSPPRR